MHDTTPPPTAMHESGRQQLLRSKEQLEARLENVFTGSKAELNQKCEQHHSIVVENNSELEKVRGVVWVWLGCE